MRSFISFVSRRQPLVVAIVLARCKRQMRHPERSNGSGRSSLRWRKRRLSSQFRACTTGARIAVTFLWFLSLQSLSFDDCVWSRIPTLQVWPQLQQRQEQKHFAVEALAVIQPSRMPHQYQSRRQRRRQGFAFLSTLLPPQSHHHNFAQTSRCLRHGDNDEDDGSVTSSNSTSSNTSSSSSNRHLYMGIDLGTSGARISVIARENDSGDTTSTATATATVNGFYEVYTKAIKWGTSGGSSDETESSEPNYGCYDDPNAWTKAAHDLMRDAVKATICGTKGTTLQSICISGTSASCLVVSSNGAVTRSPRMYNYSVPLQEPKQAKSVQDILNDFVPPRHTAHSATGTLAKLLSWQLDEPLALSEQLCHQADFVLHHCIEKENEPHESGLNICSDWHNCLKLGYDVQTLQWPSWLFDCLVSVGLDPQVVLPRAVQSPGVPVGRLRTDWARDWGLPISDDCHVQLVAGTTDSNAAFVAATNGQVQPGTAVTSLGSTLAIKQVSTAYVEDAARGVYSHRVPSVFTKSSRRNDKDDVFWLVGGASNVGCAILRALDFTDNELVTESANIDPTMDSPLSYYPLLRPGERFPVADATMQPIVTPVPALRRDYLHGILQGISDVERDGFLALAGLGAVPAYPHMVWTCGGGSRNDVWSQLRQRRLRLAFQGTASGISSDGTSSSGAEDEKSSGAAVVVQRAQQVEASYGAAILAAATFSKLQQ